MKIGLKLPHSGPFATVENIRAFALEAEKLGYDSLWTHDHIHRSVQDCEHHFAMGSIEAWETWKTPLLPNHYESISTLLYLAGITSRVLLGTSCIVLPLRNPVVLAKETACLDQYSGGRLILGVCIGGAYARVELGAVGAPHLMSKRGIVANEWIDVIRGVWREPKFSYEGQFIAVKDAEVFPKPLQQPMPPLLVGGFREPAHRRAALRGDGWMAIYPLPEQLQRVKQYICEVAAAAGRDPTKMQVVSEHWLSIDEDGGHAQARAADTIAALGGYIGSRTRQDGGRADQVSTERQFFGDPDAILAQVMRYQEAGANHLILRVYAREFGEALEALHLFKERVRDRMPV